MKRIKILALLCIFSVLLSACHRPKLAPQDSVPEETSAAEETSVESTEPTEPQNAPEPYVFHQFQDQILNAKKKNSDAVGWVFVRNTVINYPVYQYKDNDYYLKYNGSKGKDINGAIFADYRCKFNGLSQNTVIYGHNMLSGKMFGSEKKYTDKEFLEDNPIVEFSTSDQDMRWKIFAVFYIEPTFNYIEPNPSRQLFLTILNKAREKNLYKINNVDVNDDDKILTLSTCAPRSMGDLRFVVMARLMRDGENEWLSFDD